MLDRAQAKSEQTVSEDVTRGRLSTDSQIRRCSTLSRHDLDALLKGVANPDWSSPLLPFDSARLPIVAVCFMLHG